MRTPIVPKKLFPCIVTVITLAGLSACGSTPEPVATPPEIEVVQPEPEKSPPSAEEWLQAAREARSVHAAQISLLQAAKAYLNADQPHHAGAILVEMNTQYLRPHDLALFELQKGRFFASLSDWDAAAQGTENLFNRLTEQEDRMQLLWLHYHTAVARSDHFAAGLQLIRIEALLTAREQPNPDESEFTGRIWNHFRKAPADIWRSPPREATGSAAGWFSLLQRLTMVLDQQMRFQNALENWQRNYPNHAAQTIVNRLLADPQLQEPPERVAVLLPLTGSFANQGEAVRFGVLSALVEQAQENVFFIDTSQFTAAEIAQQLESYDIDLVIGPLDREAVDRLNTLDDWNYLQLTLNHPSSEGTLPRSSYFALDLAAETQAAAVALNAQGHKGVLLLAPNTNRARALADLFTQYWQENTAQGHIRTGYYGSSSEMRDLIRSELKVAESDARKEQIERILQGPKVEMEFRSRQDIDAIYLLGDAVQAQLLNPFIMSNQSAFGDRIPVYANSTVNEQSQTQDEGDLQGVRFADAPWLLPAHERADLRSQLDSLIAGWSRSQQRLTAMGYDSMRLAPRLALMRHLEGYRYDGLSGQLRIQENILLRELSWAMFDNKQIRMAPIQYVDKNNRNNL